VRKPFFRVVHADKEAKSYNDLALSPSSDEEQNEMDLIQVFKNAIPHTHGAPEIVRTPDLRPMLP
jgi:hypothetical protein